MPTVAPGSHLDVPVPLARGTGTGTRSYSLIDCSHGECGLCRVRVLSQNGPVDHRDVFLYER